MKTIVIDAGNEVYCDFCNNDFTNSNKSGGILLQSRAVCPDCSEKMEKDIKKYNEGHFVKARCPENKSFADWVREDLR